MRRTTLGLAASGTLILLLSLLWWWTTFGEVVGYGYLSLPEAGNCLLRHSDLCALATKLCLGSHPRTLLSYWNPSFWLGIAMLSASLMTFGRPQSLPSTDPSRGPR